MAKWCQWCQKWVRVAKLWDVCPTCGDADLHRMDWLR